MILNRLGTLTNSMNWRYALGEVVLIVVGVSIALAGNAWYENLRLRDDEVAILTELLDALELDIHRVSRERDTIARVNQQLTEIVELVESGQLHQGQLNTYVDPVSRFVTLQPRYGPYETLKARGADLISNRSLRSKITTLYEDELPNLVADSVIDRALARDRILPVVLDVFWLDASRGWVPKDASSDRWWRELASLSQHRSRTLANFYLPSFEQSIGLMNEVKRDIEVELQRMD